MRKVHWFSLGAAGIFSLFMGLMLFVVFTAYSRPSKKIALDIGRLKEMRGKSSTCEGV